MSPYDIDSGTYCSAFPLPPLESTPVSGYSTIDTVVNSPSDVGLFLSQGDTNSWPPDIPAYPYSPQIDAVLGCLTYPAELHPSIHGNFPLVHPSHAVKTNLAPSMSTLRGSEYFGPAPVTSNEDLTRVYLDGVDATQNWVEEGVSINVSFEQGHRYLSIDGTSDFSVPSTRLRRHHRERHNPSLCMYCSAFKWARLYQYKKHLEKEHPNVDLTFAP